MNDKNDHVQIMGRKAQSEIRVTENEEKMIYSLHIPLRIGTAVLQLKLLSFEYYFIYGNFNNIPVILFKCLTEYNRNSEYFNTNRISELNEGISASQTRCNGKVVKGIQKLIHDYEIIIVILSIEFPLKLYLFLKQYQSVLL